MSYDPLSSLNESHPCSKRGDYGVRGCKCKGADAPLEKSTGWVECELYGNVKISRCTDCGFQQQEARKA